MATRSNLLGRLIPGSPTEARQAARHRRRRQDQIVWQHSGILVSPFSIAAGHRNRAQMLDIVVTIFPTPARPLPPKY